MSRNPPFPTRRRSPSNANLNAYPVSPPASSPAYSNTRPLQIPRPSSRPSTPTNQPYISGSPQYGIPPNSAPLGPLRPQRSELRHPRGSEYSSDRGSIASQDPYRDSTEGSRGDFRGYPTTNPPTPHSRNRTPRQATSPQSENSETTPTSLNSALSAFKSAAVRKKTLESEDPEFWKEREKEIEEEKARQQRIRERVPGLKVSKASRKAGEIDAVLDQVKDGWEFVINPEFSNVELALQLLDQSSSGKDMDSFRNTKHMLSKALKGSVDKHYQAFAASLPHHASLLGHLNDTQQQVSLARASLTHAKETLGAKRTDLVQLWNRGQILEEMLRILDQMEYLKTVPDLLETLMSEKRLLQASVLLVKSLKIINNADMQEIGAVSDLRGYLVGQETALRDILVDELQSHLYLKSFWCESRWAAYSPNQQTLPRCDPDGENKNPTTELTSPTSPSFRQTRLTRFLNDLTLRPNEPPLDISDAVLGNKDRLHLISGPLSGFASQHSSNSNPESDSFAYMETLLESLAVLGKLGTALDSISQRLSGEIFNLVETTLDEVEERAEYGRRRSTLSIHGAIGKPDGDAFILANGTKLADIQGKIPTSSLRLAALESSAKRIDHEILKDLFWTLYSKLDAVAQGFRVVSEVANRIGSRRDYRDSSEAKPGTLFPLTEIWSPVQAEVRNLISDYLTDEQQGSAASRNPITSINEILREGKFSRDKIKPVFRFSDTDNKTMAKALKQHEEGLTKILKDTMPGLAPAGSGDNSQTIVSSNDDHLLGTDQHHRLLIRPDAFHVTILFQPTLSFLERVTDTLPAGVESVRASTTVLDDFVLKVYLPQLEEQVLDIFHQAVSGPDAFQPDPQSLHLSPEPLMKATMRLMALVNSLCAMLQTSPFHRENYSRLMLGVVIQFYQRCSDRFQTLTTSTTGSESDVALAAQWAQKSELQTPLSELRSLDENFSTTQQQLCNQETNIEMDLMRHKAIRKEELISSNRNIAALASLFRSVAWFTAELNSLKTSRREDFMSPTTPSSLEPMTAVTATTPFMPPLPDEDELKLSLSKEMALRFQALLRTYDQLSALILDTLRLDIRCRAIYYLDSSMRHGNYSAAYEAAEPDAHVADLNLELVQCDEILSTSLPKKARQFVFAGLGQLMEHVIIHNAKHLRLPNEFGIKKVLRNISALQQSIKTLNSDQQDAGFERAKRFYSLFWMSPQEMLNGIRKQQTFSFEEYQSMLNLQCGAVPGEASNGNGAKAVDRNYSVYVIELHGLEINGTS
ncbi:Sec8 exocyst complex component-specific domain-containing protein [Coprinopsis marcescibilis]|uniref:Exocyst complex component Sec8 n=1 Tax=Coprinopsis marcescibilis TaxID=230819 RepID=A0A5C3LDS8_COPMA|nr:Sec8 exocyst complex component-specific domain-containing protein [Coprinopsis marcescibilis]